MFNRRLKSLVLLTLAGAGCDRTMMAPDVGLRIQAAHALSGWSAAINVQDIPGTHPDFNTAALDGCPFTSRDEKTFFMASTREGGLGGIDIWMFTRASPADRWGEPVNVGAPINSPANDFCPTIGRDGHLFYFVSTRAGGCGGADIYISRIGENGAIAEPENLGCHVNSSADEQSPFPLAEAGAGPVLYFSSFRAGGYSTDGDGPVTGDSDIYVSESHGGVFGTARLVAGVNTSANDAHPNLRRDGLEIFFFSNRAGTLGGPDIYAATRPNTRTAWSTPVNLGENVNTSFAETRPSVSWDGRTLYFGSTRPGGEGDSDIYVTSRAPVKGVN